MTVSLFYAALLALLRPASSSPIPFVATADAPDSVATDGSSQRMIHKETPDMMVVTILLIVGGIIVLTVTAVKLCQRRRLNEGS
jgi:hypothetical protein